MYTQENENITAQENTNFNLQETEGLTQQNEGNVRANQGFDGSQNEENCEIFLSL
jgi:hypothetical protein